MDSDESITDSNYNVLDTKLPFPFKLHEMLNAVNNETISWQPHGKAFRVHKPKEFTQTIMPVYFRQTRYKSFQRQLHIYGFRRITKGLDKGAYYHPMFLRGMETISLQMTRCKIKGALAKVEVEEPNFYQGICDHDINSVEATSVVVPDLVTKSISDPDLVTKSIRIPDQQKFGNHIPIPTPSPGEVMERTIVLGGPSLGSYPCQPKQRPQRQPQSLKAHRDLVINGDHSQRMLLSDFEPRPLPSPQNRRGSLFGEGDEVFSFAGKKFFFVEKRMSLAPIR